MNRHFQQIILKATGAAAVEETEVIQNLWSNYGKIVRCNLTGSDYNSVVVKHVRLEEPGDHPRGWNTELSHQRKMNSYKVETAWYQHWNQNCHNGCRTPRCLALESLVDEVLIVLEDLDDAGFPYRKADASEEEMKACLSWLANFHAAFMGEQPSGLWPVGTYWHLDTRPDELEALNDNALRKAAAQIDQKLRNSPFQTFVHGDAKLANFCFSKEGKNVAAVDFQYVGGGCGMKDVAYFIGSCLYEDECRHRETQLLDYYFQALKQALIDQQKNIDPEAVEQDWRTLFPVAWTDFHRFIKGWSPGHWKIHGYSESLSRQVLAQLNEENTLS